jgi:SAM-dependent methyltransferase
MGKVLKILRGLLAPFKSLFEAVLRIETCIARNWAKSAYHRLMLIQWGLPPQPEYFDHHIDLFYHWLTSRNPIWVERGVFSGLAFANKCGEVLELACGDGFNTRNFYSLRAKHIIACDYDPKAIKSAKRKNKAANIEYVLADIRTNMPEGKFDNIVWDAAIEHFTIWEIENILKNVKARSKENCILSGYTIVEKSDRTKSLSHHEYEFKNKTDLLNLLKPFFKNVTVFETIYPDRHNLYFWACDGTVPFAAQWLQAVVQKK